MSLTIRYLHDNSVRKAAREALENSKRLFLCGYFSEAMQVTDQMVGPGPWALDAHNDLAGHLAWVHSIFCWANRSDFPGFADEPARQFAQLKAEFEADLEDCLDFMVTSDRIQNGEAGHDWSEAYFAKVERMELEDGIYKDYGQFSAELDIVLKDRLRTALNRNGRDLLGGLGFALAADDSAGPDLRVAEASRNYSTRKLVDVLARCFNRFPHGLDYMAQRCFTAAMILALSEDQSELALEQLRILMTDDDLGDLLQLVTWPPLFRLLGSGALRDHLELDDEAVATYLAAFAARQSVAKPAPEPVPEPAHDVVGLDAFRKLIEGGSMGRAETCLLDIPDSDQAAIAIRTSASTLIDDWKALRGMVEQTGRWPIVTIGWGQGGDGWEEAIRSADLFMREPYQSEVYDGVRHGLSPAALIAGASHVDIDQSLVEMAELNEEPIEEILEFELEQIESVYGKAPDQAEVLAQIDTRAPTARMAMNQYLHQWLLAQGCELQVETAHIDWFQPQDNDTLAIVLLPTANPCDAPAYLQWFGAESIGTEVVIAMLRKWHERYGAELVCHYGTMLQFQVSTRPASIAEALRLAWEQELVAPCTTALPGVSLLEHALALMASDTWFLHERP
ncbi:DUF4253 domain-containing protein [Wenzhouxiangella sp. EGI_FJ10409]|uniref:DUF4253 domain-containing protein n=1 Tax=Wenzhouxiangella sp. EGI_FJ10409 TaxID=3243767 RepID=UPI0035E3202E